jgi:hypothetical protein
MKQLFEGISFLSGILNFVMKLSIFAYRAIDRPLEVYFPVDYNGNMLFLNWTGFLFRDTQYRGFIFNILRNQKNHIVPN